MKDTITFKRFPPLKPPEFKNEEDRNQFWNDIENGVIFRNEDLEIRMKWESDEMHHRHQEEV